MVEPDFMGEDGLRAAWAAHDAEPHGPGRIARGEALVEAAERAGVTRPLVRALVTLVQDYSYGGDRPRVTVPMARLVRLWDERSEDFDEDLAHSFLWHLKWIPSALLAIPEVPLAAVRGFHADMERRFRLAGHSPRPVHQSRFYIARHLGDRDEAARAHEAWMTAERDPLADCHACERREQARWFAATGDDARAVDLLAPTLGGELSCGEEPDLSYAASLLPLARLGRFDEARSNHLIGYRMARGRIALCQAVADHLTFCALTGNIGRALEILSDHRTWLGPSVKEPGTTAGAITDLSDREAFLTAVAVVLRAVCARGLGELEVAAAPGSDGTAASLLAAAEREAFATTARYDARNGNDHRTQALREALERAPIVDELPLGIRSLIPHQVPRDGVGAPHPAPAADAAGTDLSALVRLAVAQDREGHPDALDALRRCAEVAAAQGAELEDGVVARLIRAEGVQAQDTATGPEDDAAAAERLDRASELFERAGERGQALVTTAWRVSGSARSALLHAPAPITAPDAGPGTGLENGPDSGPDIGPDSDTQAQAQARARAEAQAAADAADARLAALEAEAAALPEDPETGRVLSGVTQARVVLAYTRHTLALRTAHAAAHAQDRPYDGTPADLPTWPPLVQVLERLEELGRAYDLPGRLASAAHLRGILALEADDLETAATELGRAAELARAADRPWGCAGPEAMRGQALLSLDRPAEAEVALRAALAAFTAHPDQALSEGRLWLALGEALVRQGRDQESLEAGLRAAARLEREGDDAAATSAQHGVAATLFAMERWADAAAVLEDALGRIEEYLGPFTALEDRHRLGLCLGRLGEHRESARQLTLAAEAASKHGDTAAHAWLATDAAHALSAAGMHPEAALAFDRALSLLRETGEPLALVRTLRASAWALVDACEDEYAEDPEDPEEPENPGPAGPGAHLARPTPRDVAVDRAVARFGEAFRVLAGAGSGAGSENGAGAGSGDRNGDANPAANGGFGDGAAGDLGAELAGTPELGITHGQLAQLLWGAGRVRGAAEHADHAVEALAARLPEDAGLYVSSVLLAARVRAWALDDRDGAVARLEAAERACAGAGEPDAAAECAALREHLLAEPAHG